MAAITHDTVRCIEEAHARGERYPLTSWEVVQLARGWAGREKGARYKPLCEGGPLYVRGECGDCDIKAVDFARALLSAQGCELATAATKQQREPSVHLAMSTSSVPTAAPLSSSRETDRSELPRFSWCCENGCGPCDVRRIEFEYSRSETLRGSLLNSSTIPRLVSKCCGADLSMWDNERDEQIDVAMERMPLPTPPKERK